MPPGADSRAYVSQPPEGLAAETSLFLTSFPDYDPDFKFDQLRSLEYGRLDRGEHVYLDYTGSSLYALSQVEQHAALLANAVLGNPHSINPTSHRATELVEMTRRRILSFFHASPEEYTVVFTANASTALKIVGEAYPFERGGCLLLTSDNHTSVNGIREFARAGLARVRYVPLSGPELRVDDDKLYSYLRQSRPGRNNLFAFPAQSNFSGVQHPLSWIRAAHDHGWDVILDAAAFAPTNDLDLAQWQPDFVPISFYKLFGYPSGVGCLIARRAALAKLKRPWFAGGTIIAAPTQGSWYQLAPDETAFEDGTLDFLSIPAVAIGLNHIEGVGIDSIHSHVSYLSCWLLERLTSLRHTNGSPVVRIYGPETWNRRGANIAFNFLYPDGQVVDERIVDAAARASNLSIRTGCFCNSGAGEAAFGISANLIRGIQNGGSLTLDQYLSAIGMESGGAIRVSLGIASNFADVWRFIRFGQSFVDALPTEITALPRGRC